MEITKEIVEEFLKSHNFLYEPNQHKLCYPKLERIFKRMSENKVFSPIKIGNGKIIEGHHRYICSEILSKDIEVTKGGINLSQKVNFVWSEVVIEDIEWDKDWELRFYRKEFD